MSKNEQDEFKILCREEGNTTILCFQDDNDDRCPVKKTSCDYIALVSVTFDLAGGPPECEFEFRYGGELRRRNFPPGDFLDDQNGRYPLVRKLAALGFYMGNVIEPELIWYIKRQYRALSKDPYWTTDFRGWLEHDGQLLFIADKIYGGNGKYKSSPKLNPAYQPSPHGNIKGFLTSTSNYVVGWRPSETALGLALGSVLLGRDQFNPSGTASGVSVGFSGCTGFVAPTAFAKTVNLNYASAVFSNPFYGTRFNSVTYGDVVLPATQNANCTVNYLFGGIDKICGIFMQIDDLSGGVLPDPHKVLYQLSQSQEKGRASQTGKPQRRSRFVFLAGLSNETSLAIPDTPGGVWSRYLELNLKDGYCRDAAHAENLTGATAHHSTLGPDFIVRLLELLKTHAAWLRDLIASYRDKLHAALDSLDIKNAQDLRAQKRLAKLLCYIPASLVLYNLFYANPNDANAPSRPIDVEGFTEWLALRLSENTREAALNSNHLLRAGRLLDFIKGNFYGHFENHGTSQQVFKNNKCYNLLSNMKDFDTAPAFDVFTNNGERIGFKKKGRIVIIEKYFRFVYESHVERHNRENPNNKITTSLMQYLKQLKLDGILTHEVGRNTSRDFVFGRDKDGNPIKPLCYAFKVDPAAPDDWHDEDGAEPAPPPDFSAVTSGVEQTVAAEIDDPLGGDT